MKERIVFMGTADFSRTVLQMLLDEEYNVVGVVTQPDRYVGRKKTLTMSECKEVAVAANIPVIQPERIKKDYQDVLDLKPDLIISAAYGQIVSDVILEAPRLGCINVHASLLPKYRGASPVHYAIINGEKETGVTIMYMAHAMDAGDIISQEIISIDAQENVGTLYGELAKTGARLLRRTLPSILSGTNKRYKQDESKATYCHMFKREDEHLSWNQSAKDIYNRVRGMDPWPGNYSPYKGQNVKIWAGKVIRKDVNKSLPNGMITKLNKDSIEVKTADGIYAITELQVPGKRRMSVRDYMNGHCIFEEGKAFEED